MLNKYRELSLPLDQKTFVTKISQGSDATIGGQFFTSDFRVSYDPCICNYESILNVDFKVKNTGSIVLSGRLIGTTVPLDGSGNSPLLNGRDFLNAVYMDGWAVNGGMLTYSNIDKLVNLYKKPETPVFQQLALNTLKSLLKLPWDHSTNFWERLPAPS